MPDDALSATVSTIEMFQSAMRLSTISIAATTKSVARSTSLATTGWSRQIVPQHERHLGLDAWLHQPRVRDRFAVADRHVGEQHAEVGSIDAEHLLHRRRGQPDLAADATGTDPGSLDHALLHGVRVVDRAVGEQVEDRLARHAGRRRLDQSLRRLFDRLAHSALGSAVSARAAG